MLYEVITRQLKPGEIFKTQNTLIHYEKGAAWKQFVNATGALVTFIVLIVLIATKFVDGAWIVVLIVPLLVGFFT